MHPRMLHSKLDEQPQDSKQTIKEQIANLQPSQELIEHYKGKFESVEKEFDGLFKSLQSYKRTCDCQHKLEMDVQRSNKEIRELQSALSDMQICLLKEREAVLQLRRENEKLALTLETRTKQHDNMSHQCNQSSEDDLAFSHVRKHVGMQAKHDPTLPEVALKGASAEHQETYYLKQIQNLKNQIRNQELLAKQQIEALKKDRQLVKEETDACCLRDANKLDALQKRFKRAQDALHERTEECLQLRKHVITCVSCEALPPIDRSPKTVHRKATGIKSRFVQPAKKTKPLVTSVRKTVASCRVDKEELLKQISYYKGRCQEADQRRKFEAEGFMNDIKELRSKLGKIENLLFKISNDYFGATQNLAFLHILNQNANQAKKISADIRNVKTKIYSLENDLRHF